MKEHSIIMSAESVRATLDERKTMTRRVIKAKGLPEEIDELFYWEKPPDAIQKLWARAGLYSRNNQGLRYHGKCPYGQVGDRLWVREGFFVQPDIWENDRGPQPLHFKAGTRSEEVEDYIGKPSIFMPRWASRLTLEITDIRVERLQEISVEDCYAEGAIRLDENTFPGLPHTKFITAWDSINAKNGHGWNANDWVWVLTFKNIEDTP